MATALERRRLAQAQRDVEAAAARSKRRAELGLESAVDQSSLCPSSPDPSPSSSPAVGSVSEVTPSSTTPTPTSPAEIEVRIQESGSNATSGEDMSMTEFIEQRRREREEKRKRETEVRRGQLGITSADLDCDQSVSPHLSSIASLASVSASTSSSGLIGVASASLPGVSRVMTAAERRVMREQKQREAAVEREAQQAVVRAEMQRRLDMEREAEQAAIRLEHTYRNDRLHPNVAFPQYQALGIDLLFDATDTPRPELMRDHFAQEGRLHIDAAYRLIQRAGQLFYDETNVLELSAPLVVVGDLHGQFYDLLTLMGEAGMPPSTTYLFLGDYVDRGNFSTEVCFYLYALKLKYPRQVYLLRGNHECRQISSHFNFQKECAAKYTYGVWEALVGTFDMLPLAATVTNADGSRFLAVHGGIGPGIRSLEDIRAINRFGEPPASGNLTDLLWADPEEEDVLEEMDEDEIEEWKAITFEPNDARGCSFTFGSAGLSQFLIRNGLKALVRGHSVMQKGYKCHYFGELHSSPSCVTVFSAPNYCGKYQNLGAYAKVPSFGDALSTHTFVWSEPPYWLPDFQNCVSYSIDRVAFFIKSALEAYLTLSLSSSRSEPSSNAPISRGQLLRSVSKRLSASHAFAMAPSLDRKQYTDNLEKFHAFRQAQADEVAAEARPACGQKFRSLSKAITSPTLLALVAIKDRKTQRSKQLARTQTLTPASIQRALLAVNASPTPSTSAAAADSSSADIPQAEVIASLKAFQARTSKILAKPSLMDLFAPPAPPAPSAPPAPLAPLAPPQSTVSAPELDIHPQNNHKQDPTLDVEATIQERVVVTSSKQAEELERLRIQQQANEERLLRRLEKERLHEEHQQKKKKAKQDLEARRKEKQAAKHSKKQQLKEEKRARQRDHKSPPSRSKLPLTKIVSRLRVRSEAPFPTSSFSSSELISNAATGATTTTTTAAEQPPSIPKLHIPAPPVAAPIDSLPRLSREPSVLQVQDAIDALMQASNSGESGSGSPLEEAQKLAEAAAQEVAACEKQAAEVRLRLAAAHQRHQAALSALTALQKGGVTNAEALRVRALESISLDSSLDDCYDESCDEGGSGSESDKGPSPMPNRTRQAMYMEALSSSIAIQEELQRQQGVVRQARQAYESNASELRTISEVLRTPQKSASTQLLEKLRQRQLSLRASQASLKEAYQTEKDKLEFLLWKCSSSDVSSHAADAETTTTSPLPRKKKSKILNRPSYLLSLSPLPP